MAKPCMCCDSELSSEAVLNLLTKANSDESVTYLPPLKPDGGELEMSISFNQKTTKVQKVKYLTNVMEFSFT